MKILQDGATLMCPHAGQAQASPSVTRVTIAGAAPLTQDDRVSVSGCPFALPSGQPSPCVEVQWLRASARVTVEGKALLLDGSSGLCKAATGAPQGAVNVVVSQQRVSAS